MSQVACHLVHSQSQLSKQQNVGHIRNAKVITVGLGVAPYRQIRDLAPDGKILISFNAHNFYTGGGNNLTWNEWRVLIEKYILKDEVGQPIRDIDYPDKNYALKFSAGLARDLAKACVDALNKYPLADGLYIDDLWGTLPPRFVTAHGNYYGTITIERRWANYRENLLTNLRALLGPERILICNTANGLAKGASGISIEKHVDAATALELFEKQGGFWNIDWFRDQAIDKEVSNIRIIKGVLLEN